jgi:tetratricopeptide (TPR) repeat protein
MLFTDLVDSTATRAALGEVRADELRRVHDRLLAERVVDHGGEVVKSTGDGILATFPSAAAGLAAAVAIQQAVDRYARSPERIAAIAVRVGLSVGDVVFEDGDCHGMPVVEAARLMSVARGGQIVCSEVVRLLARGRGDHTFVSLGSLTLKGITDPVAALEVAWDPIGDDDGDDGRSSVPLPPQLAVDALLPFVSRDDEAERLGKLLGRAADAPVAVAWVSGPPGIGKTRLAAEVARRCHDEGGLVLYGRCDRDRAVPFQPFIEALRGFTDALDDRSLVPALGRDARELARLVPDLAARDPRLVAPSSASPELDHYRLCEAIGGWLAHQRRSGPVLVVLDDVHWADHRTLGAIAHLARSGHPNPTLLLATIRSTAPDSTDELTALVDDLERTGHNHRVALDGLGEGAVELLLATTAALPPGADADAAASRLHRLSGGNPLFLSSLIDAVREHGGVDDLPVDVQAAVRARVARLPDALGRLLAVAAVAGLEFDLPIVAAAADLDEEAAFDLLELAARASLVEEIALDRYRFEHALVREALQVELSPGRRARLHLRLAQALDVPDATDDVTALAALAHHYGEGARDDDTISRAIALDRRAAVRFGELLDHAAALDRLDHASVLLGRRSRPDPVARAAVLYERGMALRRTGRTLDALEVLAEASAAAAALGDALLAVDAAVAYEGAAWPAGLGMALEVIEGALAVGPVDDRCRVLAQAALVRQLEFAQRHDEALALGATTLDEAERLGDPELFGHAAFALTFALRAPARLAECEAIEKQAERAFEEAGDLVMQTQAMGHRTNTLRRLGRTAERDRIVPRLNSINRAFRQPYFDYTSVNHDYVVAFGRSDLDECVRLADQALEIGHRLVGEDPSGLHGLRMFLLRRERGELARVGPLLARLMQREPPERLWKPGLLALHVAIGQLDEARAVLDELADDDFAGVPLDPLREGCLGFLAEACFALGDGHRARLLEPLVEPYRDLTLMLGFFAGDLGSGARAFAMLARAQGHTEQAIELTNDAIAFNRDHLRSALWTAHTLVDLAELTGDGAVLAEAIALADAHRLGAVRVRCHRLDPR